MIASIAVLNACGSQGCEGCGMEPIPGGFPQEHRLDNAGQVRLSESGLEWLGSNFSSLVNAVAGGGSGSGPLTFDIPPSCSGDQRLCCDGNPCSATLDIKSAQFTPLPQSQLRLRADAEVRSSKILFEIDIPILGWFKCEVQYDSTKGSTKTVGVDADVELVIDANDGNKLKITRGATQLRNFSCDDIDIDEVTLGGFFYCNGADLLCPLFQGTLEDKLREPIVGTVDGMLADLPAGQEGRVDIGQLLSYFAHAEGKLDFFAWAGGYAEAENSGMSVGAMAGVRAPAADPCVVDCEAAGASCQPPPKLAIDRVTTFRHNDRPDGNPFHVGIGVHRLALEHAAYAAYRGGALCLRMDSSTVTALKSDLFALLIPSLAKLNTGGSLPSPLAIQLRPQQPPTVKLGKGTVTKNDQGETVIDDPLLTFEAKAIAADVYLLIEDRWVRLMSIVGDLALPFLLFANADGDLQPILGDLSTSVTNVRVENSDLLAEDPDKLALLFPSLISVAGQALAKGFSPIELPDIQGIELLLDGGSITSVEGNEFLAVFARLALAQSSSTPSPTPAMPVKPTAKVERIDLPPAGAFSVQQRRADQRPPAVTLIVDAEPAASSVAFGEQLQWTYRVDGGFYRPWVSLPRGGRLVVRDPALWLPGQHAIEVMARIEDRPRSTVPEPVLLQVTIDPGAAAVVAAREGLTEVSTATVTDEAAGCATAGGPHAGWLVLLFLALGVLLRRRSR